MSDIDEYLILAYQDALESGFEGSLDDYVESVTDDTDIDQDEYDMLFDDSGNFESDEHDFELDFS